MNDGCSCSRVCLWVSAGKLNVCSSCVSGRERKKERSSGYKKVAGWPGRRQTRSADIMMEVNASSTRVSDTRFEEVCHVPADFHGLSFPRTTIGFVELVQSLREFRGLQVAIEIHYRHDGIAAMRDLEPGRCYRQYGRRMF